MQRADGKEERRLKREKVKDKKRKRNQVRVGLESLRKRESEVKQVF